MSEKGIDLPIDFEEGEGVNGVLAWEVGTLDDGRVVVTLTESDDGLHGYQSVRAMPPDTAARFARALARVAGKLDKGAADG